MNPKRQIIGQAIMDLEENREVVRQVYEEWKNMAPPSPTAYYEQIKELNTAMEKARDERINIAVRLFRDYVDAQGNPIIGDPNEAFYDPNPTPMLSVADFHRGPGMSRSYPVITGRSTVVARNGEGTLRRIDKFIKQLKHKMKTRKDLRENNPFQLTEAKLKQMIYEELIQEAAKGPRDLPEDVYVRVFEWQRRIVVMFTDANGNQIYPANIETDEDNPVYGDISFFEEDPDTRPCDGSSIIAVSDVADGWGPFLYDIAMEIATMRTNGLASDRHSVSPEAQDVWDYYSKFRSDVKAHQLDDEYNSLTPDESDNCGQSQSRERAIDYGGEWKDNALSKRFTKESTTLNLIRDKLIWEL